MPAVNITHPGQFGDLVCVTSGPRTAGAYGWALNDEMVCSGYALPRVQYEIAPGGPLPCRPLTCRNRFYPSLIHRMFTGLVQTLAEVAGLVPEPGGVRLVVREPGLAARAELGASIATNGCCLTVVEMDGDCLSFQAGEETLSRTNLGRLKPGDRVNLEGSLRMGDEIGGHLVTGHIDGLATVDERIEDAEWATFWFRVPASLTRQMASKGSVTVDGVSLTLVEVEDQRFSVALIPHTLSATTLGFRQVGDTVNIETDVLAKYVERQLSTRDK